MRYGKQKIDLETASAFKLKYRDGLITALRLCEWNVTRTAKKVGLSRSSMYRRMHVLSIKIPADHRPHRGRSIFSHVIAGVK